MSRKSGALTYRTPKGLLRPVAGNLYLYLLLCRVKEKKNIVHTIKRKRANRLGDILLRNSLLKHIIGEEVEGRIEVTGRQGRKKRTATG